MKWVERATQPKSEPPDGNSGRCPDGTSTRWDLLQLQMIFESRLRRADAMILNSTISILQNSFFSSYWVFGRMQPLTFGNASAEYR